MRTLTVTRKGKLAGGMLPYWIISADIINQMPARFQKYTEAKMDATGHARPTIAVEQLDALGIRIGNGETVTMELEHDIAAVYVCTMDGIISEPAVLPQSADIHLTLTTRGGFIRLPHPCFLSEKE